MSQVQLTPAEREAEGWPGCPCHVFRHVIPRNAEPPHVISRRESFASRVRVYMCISMLISSLRARFNRRLTISIRLLLDLSSHLQII
jgi:hypothetical protein